MAFIETLLHTLLLLASLVGAPHTALNTFWEPPHTLSAVRSTLDDIVTRSLQNDARYQQAAVHSGAETPAPATLEEALVNILCTVRTTEAVRTISGSGVFIDSQGVILTNAHLAQFLLLNDDEAHTSATCTIRQGDPATPRYRAALLYLSPVWLVENAHQLYAKVPVGTGARDFALLLVTEALGGALPDSFPALPLASSAYRFDAAPVTAAGYPTAHIDHPETLAATVASTTITQLYTFDNGTVDVIALAPSSVGEQGASGGPVLDHRGVAIGLIVTRGNTKTDGAQSLRALTIPYIDRTLTKETGLGLERTLSGDLPLRAQVFTDTLLPPLRTTLEVQQP